MFSKMRWLRNLFFRRHANDDLAEEIEQHIAERTTVLIEQGRDPEEAAREARRAFGNRTLARERSIEIWQWRWLENLWADLRFALHQLRKSPGYTLTAILTLAINIGANAAIFTLIDDIMLRSLPVPHPEQLVEIGFRSPTSTDFLDGQSPRSMDYLRDHVSGLQSISGWTGDAVFVADDHGTLRSVVASLPTGSGFSVLGIRPYLGRLLTPTDDRPGGPEGGWPVVLHYGFWKDNYHADPRVIGRHIQVSGQPAIIVGVLPPGFTGVYTDAPPKLYLPSHFATAVAASPQENPYRPDIFFLAAIGRLRSNTSLAQLNAELAVANPSFSHTFVLPATHDEPVLRNATLTARPCGRGFSFYIEQQYRQPLFLLQGIVLLVLMLCCINLGGLEVARVQARQHEFAVRTALGAGRGRILQQCLTESMLLAFAGSALAALLAYFSTAALSSFLTPTGSAEPTSLRPDPRVLIVTTALAFITTLLFGLAPALIAGRAAPGTLLKSRGAQQRRNPLRRRLFIPAQFALALTLVLGAGLFSQTLQRLRSNHTGFEPEHIMTVQAQFQFLKKSPAEIAALYRSMVDHLRDAAGIQLAAYTGGKPLDGYVAKVTVRPLARAHSEHSIAYNQIGDGYFQTLGTRVLAGREFTADDRDQSTCIVNQSAARVLFSAGAPLGDTIKAVNDAVGWEHLDITCRIVGMVQDAPYASLRERDEPMVYFPITAASFHGSYSNNMSFMIRAQTDAEAIAAYRATLARYAPNTGIMTFLPLRDQVDQSLGSERLIATLTNIFAAIALLLSGIGIFGLLALRVQERTPEIGVRIAVGASRAHLLRMVLGEALRMVAIGSVAGLALASIGYVFIHRFLYGASPADLRIAIASVLVLIAVALLAAAIPARRAIQLDPIQALRTE